MKNQGLYNLVFLKHHGDMGEISIFQCPLDIVLEKGADVSCNTGYGSSNGICVTNSFIVQADTARQIVETCGGTFPPQDVTGIAQEETRKVYVPFE